MNRWGDDIVPAYKKQKATGNRAKDENKIQFSKKDSKQNKKRLGVSIL